MKTLKGTQFEIRVNPSEMVMAVKKKIEEIQGKDNYPCGQQLLIHSGKVLKDESTLEENKVGENGFLVVMLSKSKTSGSGGASSSQRQQPSPAVAPAQPATPDPPLQASSSVTTASESQNVPTSSVTTASESQNVPTVPADAYGQAASSLVAGSNLEEVVNQLMDMGGGNWDKDTVLRALRAAYNNPERAVDYLYSGIPATTEVAIPVSRSSASQTSNQGANSAEASPQSGVPNSAPLNMFPQGTSVPVGGVAGGSLDFLRQNQQFQALRAMVQANPQILQPMLRELSKQNPQLLRIIQEHNAEFLQLINEPLEDAEDVEGDLFDEPEQEMPHTISVSPEEQEAVERLEAMGFDRTSVIEAFLACDKNEQLAANYLLEHAGDEE